MSVVSISIENQVATVKVNNPPVNALSHAVRDGLMQAAIDLDTNDEVKIVVLICEGRTFIAGADIREFGKPFKEPGLPDVIHRIEAAEKPWIAAVHGTALGGGFEVALGCHYRVGVPSAKVGLPEVHLGLLPGAGGTVRLPRLIAAETAIEMVVTGKPISAVQAKSYGIFDALAEEGELAEFADQFALQKKDKPKPVGLSSRNPVTQPDKAASNAILEGVTAKAKGQLSPVVGAKSVLEGIALPIEDAFAQEREKFKMLHETDQSKAMRHVFFAERQTSKVSMIEGIKPKSIQSVGIVGGGTMGSGISAACLLAGLKVTMVERDADAVNAGRDRVEKILEASHKRGIIGDEKLAAIRDNFSAGDDYKSFSDADLIIEAAFEEMEVKQAIFRELDAATKPDAILASNTSYMDVNEIGSVVKDPSRVLGMHFFSPAHIMKLVEVIFTDTSAPETIATGFALAKKIRKVPVLSGVCEGFIGNRILSAYGKQAAFMLEDGCLPQEVDQAMLDMGMPMGIFQMGDMAGLDIGWATRKRLAATRDPNERYVRIADRICELGRFGQKTGAGWYSYEHNPRVGTPDPLVEKIIMEESAAKGITRRQFTQDEIKERILGAMSSEGKKILDEGIAQRASDIDMVMILGYGFPRWRGGPMFAAGIV